LPDVSVRKAVPADAPGILLCLAEAFAPYRSRYTAEAFADTVLDLQSLARRMSAMTILVAVVRGDPQAAAGTVAGHEIAGTIACGLVSLVGVVSSDAIEKPVPASQSGFFSNAGDFGGSGFRSRDVPITRLSMRSASTAARYHHYPPSTRSHRDPLRYTKGTAS